MSRRVHLALTLLLLASCADDESGGAGGAGAGPTGGGGAAAEGGSSAATGGGGSMNVGGPFTCRADADGKTTLVFVNQCSAPIELRGSDLADATLAPGHYECRDAGTDVEQLNAKRYWGFIGEDPGGGHHTLAEFTFNTDFNDFDWYNISHVDAHNLTMQIEPLDRADCDTLTCSDPTLLTDCPDVGRLENGAGELVSCVSPERDNPDSPVALHFESCDDAYAWSGDDQQGDDPSPVRACAGEDFKIVFCP
ncbi:MAG: thaumatin family protein [Polyangiaceae bacterium]